MRRALPTGWCCVLLAAVALLGSPGFGAEEAAALPPDVLTLRDGSEVGCTAGVIDARGQVSFGAPFLARPAQTRLADMLRLQLKRTVAEKAGAHIVRLTNGDRFVGDLVEMTEDEVILDSALFGELEIPRQFVYSISRRSHNPVLVASDFATGSMDGWKKMSGRWTLTRDGLYGTADAVRGVNIIERKVEHEGAVTLVLQLDGSNQKEPKRFSVTVEMLTSLTVGMLPERVNGNLRLPGLAGWRRRDVTGACDSFKEGKGELRIAYDPNAETHLQVWVNGKAIKFMKDMESAPLKGQTVRIRTYSSIILRSVQMYAGVVEPGVDNMKPAEDVDVVVMVNRDAIRVKESFVEDGRATLHTADGEYKLDMAKIAHIVMRSAGRKALPERAGDVRVQFESSRVTLKLGQLTAEHFTGRAESVGDVRVQRAAVAGINVDVSMAKRTAAKKSPWPTLPRMRLPDGTALYVKVTGMKDGKVAVTAPWLVGTAVARLSALARLNMGRPGLAERQSETLLLTDGSTIGCAMKSLGAQACAFKSPILGALSVSRTHISAITTGRAGGLVLAHDFTTGKLPEGSVQVGRWSVDEQGLVARSAQPCLLAVPMVHDGALTVELVVKTDPDKNSFCHAITLYAPKVPTDVHRQTGLRVLFTDDSIAAFGISGFVPRLHAGQTPFFRPQGGTIMLSCDPVAGTIQCSVDDRPLGELKRPYTPKATKFLLLSVYRTGAEARILSLRVWKGLALSGAGAVELDKTQDIIIDAGKRTPAGQVSIADGQVVAANGTIKHPLTDVMTIVMAADARIDVPRKPGQSTVRLASGSILMRVDTMDAKFLTGVSPTLGKLRIPRAAVQNIVVRELVPIKRKPTPVSIVNPWGRP